MGEGPPDGDGYSSEMLFGICDSIARLEGSPLVYGIRHAFFMYPPFRRNSRGDLNTRSPKASVMLLQIAYKITHRRVGD